MIIKKILGIAITRKGAVELVASDEKASVVLAQLEALDPGKYATAGLVRTPALTNQVNFAQPEPKSSK